MPTTPRRHLFVPRRPSFEPSGRLLLLALALDRTGGHPDNVAATARLLNASDQSVRDWRRTLVVDGLLDRRGGFLVPGANLPAWTDRAKADFAARGLRYSHDPLPRRFLGRSPSASILHAAAVTYADAVGWERERRFVRSDAERAALANVSRPTVRAARAALEAAGLVDVEALQRGRATLRRVSIREGGKATYGAPIGHHRATAMAARAARHRDAAQCLVSAPELRPIAAAATPQPIASATPQPIAYHHQVPTGLSTIKTENGLLRKDGWIAPRKKDGAGPEAIRQRCSTFFSDRTALARCVSIASRRPEHATSELLALAGCFDGSRRKSAEWSAALVRRWRNDAPTLLLGVIADIVAGTGRNRAANIGAVVAARLPRLLAGKATDALSHTMQGRSVADILAAAVAKGSITRTA